MTASLVSISWSAYELTSESGFWWSLNEKSDFVILPGRLCSQISSLISSIYTTSSWSRWMSFRASVKIWSSSCFIEVSAFHFLLIWLNSKTSPSITPYSISSISIISITSQTLSSCCCYSSVKGSGSVSSSSSKVFLISTWVSVISWPLLSVI